MSDSRNDKSLRRSAIRAARILRNATRSACYAGEASNIRTGHHGMAKQAKTQSSRKVGV